MPPILPWLPATELVYGMNVNLCNHVAIKTAEKTNAAVAKMRSGERPKPWGPLNIQFEIDGQKIKFDSNAYVGGEIGETRITVENVITFIEGKKQVEFIFTEMTEANFPTGKRRDAGEETWTRIKLQAVIMTDLPISVSATLPGKLMKNLADLPSGFNHALGDLVIENVQGRVINFDSSAYQAHAHQMHQDFQESIKG